MTKGRLTTILLEAIEIGNLVLIKELIKAGANIHADNDCALRLASIYGRTEVVKVLIAAGSNIHARNDEALRFASKKGQTEVVKLLEERMKNG